MSEEPGADVLVTHSAMVYAENMNVANFIIDALGEAGLITVMSRSARWFRLHLTVRGWDRVSELQRLESSSESQQAFVAMWFVREMEKEIFEKGLKPGIEAAGYLPMKIDTKPFLGKICDEIIAEIRKSRFLVADVTGQRQGVYSEAGFAMGLGLPVIWTCRKTEIKKIHFDTRQYNHIVWDAPEELRKALKNRIEATIT